MDLPRASRVTLGRARRLRKEMTDAEKELWSTLRNDALGLRFRKQHPIGPYIADFACYPLKIVVEVDGATHGTEEERRHDAKRDAYLTRSGWIVLRFTNEDVYKDLDSVIEAIGLAVHDARAEL
jgi:very-short-patch-repair endonuclease